MVKLIVTDMDGTLLDDNKSLSPDFWDIEKQLMDKGILFAVASGRQYYNLEKVFSEVRDRTVFIAENGSFAMYRGEELFTVPLDKGAVSRFIALGRRIPDVDLIVCGKESAYLESKNQRFIDEVHRHYERVTIVDDLTHIDDTILKFTICDFNDVAGHTYPHFAPFSGDFKVAISGKIWIDVTDNEANKGTALRRVQEKMGIPREETMVFGDYLNDLEMMSEAKYSYAMKNAHADILKIATHVTELDNNAFGVTETIKRLLKDI